MSGLNQECVKVTVTIEKRRVEGNNTVFYSLKIHS